MNNLTPLDYACRNYAELAPTNFNHLVELSKKEANRAWLTDTHNILGFNEAPGDEKQNILREFIGNAQFKKTNRQIELGALAAVKEPAPWTDIEKGITTAFYYGEVVLMASIYLNGASQFTKGGEIATDVEVALMDYAHDINNNIRSMREAALPVPTAPSVLHVIRSNFPLFTNDLYATIPAHMGSLTGPRALQAPHVETYRPYGPSG